MPNRDNPNGFTAIRHGSGGDVRAERIKLAAANAIIGVGDPLTRTAAGVWDRWSAGQTWDGVATEPAAAASGKEILAIIDSNVVFEAQCDDTTGVLTLETGIHLNFDIILGNAVNDRSIAEIDESTGATTAALPGKVLRLSKRVGNAYGQFNRLEVMMNQTARHAGVAGI